MLCVVFHPGVCDFVTPTALRRRARRRQRAPQLHMYSLSGQGPHCNLVFFEDHDVMVVQALIYLWLQKKKLSAVTHKENYNLLSPFIFLPC
jgi:hypothetical protein